MNARLFEPQPVERLVEQIDVGAQALAEQVRHWYPCPPAAELAGARRAVDGLGRLLTELAQQQEAGE